MEDPRLAATATPLAKRCPKPIAKTRRVALGTVVTMLAFRGYTTLAKIDTRHRTAQTLRWGRAVFGRKQPAAAAPLHRHLSNAECSLLWNAACLMAAQ
jgi:hypothetical protein